MIYAVMDPLQIIAKYPTNLADGLGANVPYAIQGVCFLQLIRISRDNNVSCSYELPATCFKTEFILKSTSTPRFRPRLCTKGNVSFGRSFDPRAGSLQNPIRGKSVSEVPGSSGEGRVPETAGVRSEFPLSKSFE